MEILALIIIGLLVAVIITLAGMINDEHAKNEKLLRELANYKRTLGGTVNRNYTGVHVCERKIRR